MAVVESAILCVIEMGCPLLAELAERNEARSLSAVAGDRVSLDNLLGLEVFGCFADEVFVPSLLVDFHWFWLVLRLVGVRVMRDAPPVRTLSEGPEVGWCD